MTHLRRGIVLLEALVALVLVGGASLQAIAVLRQAKRARISAVQQASRLRQADRLLSSVALWTTDELDRHLGRRPQGPWALEVQRRAEGLYVIRVLDRAGERVWLETVLAGAR